MVLANVVNLNEFQFQNRNTNVRAGRGSIRETILKTSFESRAIIGRVGREHANVT